MYFIHQHMAHATKRHLHKNSFKYIIDKYLKKKDCRLEMDTLVYVRVVCNLTSINNTPIHILLKIFPIS